MKWRTAVLVAMAVVVLSGTASAAVITPSLCPANTHEATPGNSTCLSNERRVFPSGHTGWVYATDRDARMRLRVEMVAGGLVVGAALLVASTRRRTSDASVSSVASA